MGKFDQGTDIFDIFRLSCFVISIVIFFEGDIFSIQWVKLLFSPGVQNAVCATHIELQMCVNGDVAFVIWDSLHLNSYQLRTCM